MRRLEMTFNMFMDRYTAIVLFCIVLLLVAVAGIRPAASQIVAPPEQEPGDSVVTHIVPAAAYASDIGLLGAVAISRYRYHPQASPFVSLTEMRLQASTKMYLDLRVIYEHTETLGRPIRSKWTLRTERHPYDNYFGIGNSTVFDSDMWRDQYYYYDVMRADFSWQGRKNVYRPLYREATLDVTGYAGIGYEQPVENRDNLINDDLPTGIGGGWTNRLGIGMIWENRDNDYAATRGNRFEIRAKWAPPFLLSDYPMALIDADIRQFVTIPTSWLHPVLALRAAGSHAFGNIPYWNMPYLGDDQTIRGYPVYRFRGDAAVFYNIELRTWLYEHPYLEFNFGIHAFHDSGRVFTAGDGVRELFRDYHRTFGGGIAMALFDPGFIVRFDAGFSEEMYRLYMNIGYMF